MRVPTFLLSFSSSIPASDGRHAGARPAERVAVHAVRSGVVGDNRLFQSLMGETAGRNVASAKFIRNVHRERFAPLAQALGLDLDAIDLTRQTGILVLSQALPFRQAPPQLEGVTVETDASTHDGLSVQLRVRPVAPHHQGRTHQGWLFALIDRAAAEDCVYPNLRIRS